MGERVVHWRIDDPRALAMELAPVEPGWGVVTSQPLFPFRPVVLDLCCGGGGAAEGYIRAGFDVVGVDLEDHHASYPGLFIRGDMFDLAPQLSRRFSPVLVHASPPCQGYTTMSAKHRGKGTKADGRAREIARCRAMLKAMGLSYVLENVAGARRAMRSPIVLTGGMYGLRVHRPRLFEASFPLPQPPRAPKPTDCVGVYGTYPDGRRLWTRADGTELRCVSSVEEGREAMGLEVSCHTWREVAEAIPPAFSHHVGASLAAHLAT